MRFSSLRLEQYGFYKSRVLDLNHAPGLTVIHGPNEQGKSTCLAAIRDFLFGIPHTSAHGQVFGYDRMRIFATLQLANGKSAVLQRKKGKGSSKTLLNEDGTPADESLLAAALAAMTRQRFESMFGLDHEALRAGGQQLLSADGDIGRLIVEAGGGLKSLTGAIERLAAEADTLFAPRRAADRAFYKACDAYMDAEAALKAGLLTHDAYRDVQARHDAAAEAIGRLQEAQSALRQRQFQLKRLERAIPLLCDLDGLDQRLAAFDDLAGLGERFPEQAEQALADHAAALAQYARADRTRNDIEAELAGLPDEPVLLSLEAEIRDAVELSVLASKARSDKPGLERALSESQGKLASLRASLDLPDHADLSQCVPGMDALSRLQELANEGSRYETDIDTADEQARNASDARKSLRQQAEEHRRAGTDRAHGLAMAELSGLTALVRLLDERTNQLGSLQADMDAGLQAIGQASIHALRCLSLPDMADVQHEIDRRSQCEASLDKLGTTIRTQMLALEKNRAKIDTLKRGASIPTAAAIHGARQDRAAALKPITQAYLAGIPLASRPLAADLFAGQRDTNGAVTLDERTEAVVQLERSITDADDLADRKSIEAARVAELELAEQAMRDATVEIDAATREMQRVEGQLAAGTLAWNQAWPDIAFLPDLARIRAFLQASTRLMEQADRVTALQEEIGRLRAESCAGLELLGQAENVLLRPDERSDKLVERLRAVNQAAARHDRHYAEYLHGQESLAAAEQQETRFTALAAQLREKRVAWQAEWSAAARSLHLPAGVPLQRAQTVANEWAAAKGVLEKVALLRRGLDDMTALEQRLAQQLGTIAGKLNFALPDNPVAAAAMLKDRFDTASSADRARRALAPRLAHASNDCDRLKHEAALVADSIASLAERAGCPASELAGAALRCRERMSLAALQRQKLDALHAAGDAFHRAELLGQRGDRNLDQIRIELAQLDDDDARVQADIRQAIEHAQDCKRKLEQFDCETSAMEMVSGRESAAADMHQVIERYLEVTLARELLSAAVNQIRAEHQDPLIKRAGELFALATNGAFTAVDTDVDDKGQPVVVAMRQTGEPAPIDVLSDGTRDQLFLAFRIASIEAYCLAAEPLPFIADDLLVHFDDARSEACLRLLAELGKKTQVLLFTHHRSVADAAAAMATRGECSIAELV
jgi:uncharacterized protein YhaN